MKTQEEIDAVRAEYKRLWDVDMERKRGKLAFLKANLDARAALPPSLHIPAEPGEILPGLRLRAQIESLEEDIAWREAQWALVEDEYAANDAERLRQEDARAAAEVPF